MGPGTWRACRSSSRATSRPPSWATSEVPAAPVPGGAASSSPSGTPASAASSRMRGRPASLHHRQLALPDAHACPDPGAILLFARSEPTAVLDPLRHAATCVPGPEQDHGSSNQLKRRTRAKRRPVATGCIMHDAHERRPEGKRKLIDADHQPNERAELLHAATRRRG